MTNCTQESFQFPACKRPGVAANFQGGEITSDGGVLLLRQVDRRLGLSAAVVGVLNDPRRPASIDPDGLSLLRQRVYALALGRTEELVSYLRRSKIDGAKHAWAILALLVRRLRQAWPQVKIIVPADSGFCRPRMRSWCERNHVGYLVGIANNQRLNALTAQLQRGAQECYAGTGTKVRWFSDIRYAAGGWNRPRRVIAKIEQPCQGP